MQALALKEGTRNAPWGFSRRLRNAFPRERLRLIWSNVNQRWELWRRLQRQEGWVFITPWFREPTEELIEALRAGYVGVGIRDVNKFVADDLAEKDREEQARRDARRIEIKDRVKATARYLPGALGGDIPLNPQYTPGWRKS